MSAGLGVLRLPPAAFWAMTPRELDGLNGGTRAGPLGRGELQDLMQLFPDRE